MQMRFTFILFLSFLFLGLTAQTVSGDIKDPNGDPLAFASVVEKGTTNGVDTDIDGHFSIKLTSSKATLEFSYLGFASQTILYAGQKQLQVTLQEDAQVLGDVIVVGYGVQKKSDVTGAVSSIKVEDATALPTTNVAEMLRGKSAGVQITLTDPRPGGNSSILIRGKNSFIGGNEPLIVLDGVPIDDINSVNSEDVKSIEILKDASAQAIYGARASNGVILITTKRGSEGKLKAAYHGFYGESWLTKNFELYSGEEWAQLRREAFRSDDPNDEYLPDDFVFTPLQLEAMGKGEYVNWEDEILQNAVQQSHSISLQGGGDKASIYSGFSYYDQAGIIPGSKYKRGTARVNFDYKVSDRVSFGANIYLLTDRQDKEDSGIGQRYITMSPIARVHDDAGKVIRFPTGEEATTSPLWNNKENTEDYKANNYQFTLFSDFNIFKNFNYRVRGSITRQNKNGGRYRSRLHSSTFAKEGVAELITSTGEEFLIENILTYDWKMNRNHKVDFMAMQSVNERKATYTKSVAAGFPNDILGYNGIASATDVSPIQRSAWRRRLLSFLGRARYSLMDRYLLTLTGRADGSSVFAPNKKWGFFPSAAIGWKAHLEPFLKDVSFLNELKFRASYGSIGNEAIKPYQTLGTATPRNYIFGDKSYGGYGPGNSLFNPLLKWETSTTFNAGLDFGLFKNILVGNFEVYNTETTDLLVDRKTPGSTGYRTIISNVGRVQNKGIELGLTGNIIRKKNLDWSVTTTFSRNRNKIIELYGEVDKEGKLLDDIGSRRFIGQPINVIHQYEFDGIWQVEDNIAESHQPDAQPGMIRVKDLNGDGVIDTDDRQIIRADPDWYGSISSRINFRGVELYADVYIVEGATKTNDFLADWGKGGTLQGALNGIKVDYWTPENPSDRYPRPRQSLQDRYLWSSAVSDASYIRLRTLSLAYHLPKKWLNKIGFGGVTLYGTASNLLTWTDFKSYSPETLPGQYPDGKSFIFGLKISNK